MSMDYHNYYREKAEAETRKREHDYKNRFGSYTESSTTNVEADYTKFCNTVKETLLSECFMKILNESLTRNLIYEDDDKLLLQEMVSNYIKEKNVNILISKIKYNSTLLNECCKTIDNHYKMIIEKVDKKEAESYRVVSSDKDSFYEELNIKDTGEASESIRMKVSLAIDDFIQDNMNSKMKIDDTLRELKEKNDDTKNKFRESAESLAREKINNVRNSNRKLFGEMVHRLSKKSITDQVYVEAFTQDNKLDLDRIVNRVSLMYTFLEMVNTLKIEKVDERYITDMLRNF